MKKITGFALIGVLVLSLIGAVALAAPDANSDQGQPGFFPRPCGPTAAQLANMTDEQKAQIATWQKEMFEQRKQMLQKEVEWGWITQSQADEHISFMEQCIKNGNFGMMGMGFGPGMRHHGRGMGPANGGCVYNNVPAQQ
ncbi:DUF2680 domain-containing protein [Sporomusa acidovorans]|uniref:DUF2680 domain-containing protein n=1 Tax=Sporomusa acidovorans (strain ATCC 49682 / DSM 3132 / Mol) TaxID=1123286 RepID=A0ABZ3IYB7_SPOA4|nr:DUF2680 domain-containing protein [Sporomusa acidovorans]OZC22212.1 hypothetical protein SPACI_15630 [Sporomusa acidovorans DSM 3132]SDE81494.1 Protein of unknown function [Sporomusa acidovorans]